MNDLTLVNRNEYQTQKGKDFLKSTNEMEKTLKEVSLKEYREWYQKLIVKTPKEKTIKKFNSEIQKWKLYNLTFYETCENNHTRFIRFYGIPTPLMQIILHRFFKPFNDFTKNGLSDLKVTPQDPEFSETLLIEGNPVVFNDRNIEQQIMYLEFWKEFQIFRN